MLRLLFYYSLLPQFVQGLIDYCIERFTETHADNLATGFICKFMEYETYAQIRQDLKGFFYADGNVYIIRSSLIKEGKVFGEKVEIVLTGKEKNVEIDDNF